MLWRDLLDFSISVLQETKVVIEGTKAISRHYQWVALSKPVQGNWKCSAVTNENCWLLRQISRRIRMSTGHMTFSWRKNQQGNKTFNQSGQLVSEQWNDKWRRIKIMHGEPRSRVWTCEIIELSWKTSKLILTCWPPDGDYSFSLCLFKSPKIKLLRSKYLSIIQFNVEGQGWCNEVNMTTCIVLAQSPTCRTPIPIPLMTFRKFEQSLKWRDSSRNRTLIVNMVHKSFPFFLLLTIQSDLSNIRIKRKWENTS